MLHKALADSIRDVDTLQGIVSGYASAFDNIDDDGDIIVRGAFTKTLAEQGPNAKQPRIKFLYQHDATKLLGVPSVLREDDYGLYYEAKLASTPLAQDVLALMAEGILTEHSIGYEVVQAHFDRTRGARILSELKLYEFSCVTWGANAQTPVVSVKALTTPAHVQALASKAAKIDALLHRGTLRSAALCETLERDLKALQTALAPTRATVSQPYSITGVLDTMSELADRLGSKDAKGASQADKDAQEARSKKYSIGIKDGGNVTKPSQWSDLSDADFGDPVNYKLPMPDKAHADNAASRFGQEATRSQYTKAEQDIIDKRIAAAQKKFGEDSGDTAGSGGKGASMHRMVKGTGGSVAVSEDGTHAAYTGSHTHSHKAMGAQGDDDMHEHAHAHDGDADHGHSHSEPKSVAISLDGKPLTTAPLGGKQTRKKALDFNAALTQVSADDTLQDDWGDSFQALVNALYSVMCHAHYAGMMVSDAEDDAGNDPQGAAETVLSQFSNHMSDLIKQSLAADFVPCLDGDGDSFLDPDGPNASDADDWKGRDPRRAPSAPARLGKAGRSISAPNRAVLTDALDGISDGIAQIKAHHGAIADLLKKTDPDAVRQDEDDTQGDDDSENGGTDPNKGRHAHASETTRRSANTAATTRGSFDLSALDADFQALKSRLMAERTR